MPLERSHRNCPYEFIVPLVLATEPDALEPWRLGRKTAGITAPPDITSGVE